MRPARRDHRVRFFEGQAQRLLDDHVPAGGDGVDREARVQVIRQADVDDVAVDPRECLLEIGQPARDAVLLRERARVVLGSRIDGDDLGIGHEAVKASA